MKWSVGSWTIHLTDLRCNIATCAERQNREYLAKLAKNQMRDNAQMWLCTKNSFISVVQHRERPDDVLVRARVKNHLVRFFPEKSGQIQRDDDADYRWRLLIPKQELADRISVYILQSLNYDNFKAAQDADDPAWSCFLHEVWGEGLRLQK